jgi:hypothetical protein
MMPNIFRLVARLLGTSLFLAAGPFLQAADLPVSPDGGVLRMRFLTNSAGETLVKYNNLTASLLKNTTNKLVNVTQLAANKGAQFSLIPDDVTVDLTSEQFGGWQAEIPVKQSLQFSFDYPRNWIDLATSDLNRQPVGFTFSDGAKAQMNGSAQGRLEVMNDGTYAFFATGPVSGVTADGVPIHFGNVFPPLFGGKLMAPKGTNANARFARATPVTQLTFLGQIDSGLRAKIGETVVALERDVPREVTTANGGRVSLLFNSSKRSVDWTVERGLIRFTVDSFSCWKALGTSGQSASMQWDTNGFLMEIKNRSGAAAFQRTLLVNLNPSLNVSVGDSATFQYGRTGDCSTFVTSAHGGETILYNAQTGRYIRLDEGNMNIISGSPDNLVTETAGAPRAKVRLGWNTDEQIELKSADSSLKVPINGDQAFQAGPNQDLKVSYQGKDQLTLTAETGSFAVTPDILPNISIELSEGAGVTLGLDRGNDIFRLQPVISNVTAVDLRTATGFYPNLEPGTRITFVINRSTFTSDGDEGTLIFTETAGAGAPTITGDLNTRPTFNGRGDVTFFGGTSANLSEPRVEEPPVTTIE